MRKTILLLLLSLTINSFAQPANDTCANAQVITVTTASNTNITFDTATAVSNNEVGCSGTTAADYVDVWYEFTMPVNGNVFVDGSIAWNKFQLLDACNGTELFCISSSGFFYNLTAGTTYKLRVYRETSSATNSYQDFNIQAYDLLSSDNCANAEPITISTATALTVDFELGGAQPVNEINCANAFARDYVSAWYEFTMPVNGNVYVDASIAWNRFQLLDACNGTELFCFNGDGVFSGLTAGTTYKLRLYRYDNYATSSYKSFTIQAFTQVTNDTCATAEVLAVATANALTIPFELRAAASNNEMGCSGTSPTLYSDVWYEFTMPVNGNVYVDGSISWNKFQLLDACNGNELFCLSNDGYFYNLTAGTTYKLRVFRQNSQVPSSYREFTIQAFSQATNDDCANAETISVTTASATDVSFELRGAQNHTEEGCSGSTTADYVDLWYEFTMPVNGNVLIDGSIPWNKFQILDACNGNELLCTGNTGIAYALVAGNTYKIRVYRATGSAASTYRSFNIQAFPQIANDDCANAETITLIAGTTVNTTFELVGAQSNIEAGCAGDTPANYHDAWYEFTMPTQGNIFVNGFLNWNKFQLFDACNGNELYCFSNTGYFNNLTSGTTYKLRVYRTNIYAPAAFKRFSLNFTSTLATEDNSFLKENLIVQNTNNSSVKIISRNGKLVKKISFYSILGKKIMDNTPNQSEFEIATPNIKSGSVIFVKAQLENNKVISTKFLYQ